MRRSPNRLKGIVLITTLLVMFFLVMLATAMVSVSRASLGLTGSFHDRECALHAAQAGLDYALARLERNAYWQGDDSTVPNAANGFTVTENWLGKNICRGSLGNGEVFYINFEHNTNLFDPEQNFTTYKSANNLLGQLGNEYNNTCADGTLIRTLPINTVQIIVKGAYGRSTRYVEAMYAYDGPTSIDSAAISSNKMIINLADATSKWVVSSENEEKPRIRSNYALSDFPGGEDNTSIKAGAADVALSGPQVDLSGGVAVARGDIDLGSSFNGTADPRTAINYPIPELNMSDIPANQSEADLPAGTYVVTGPSQVAYYSYYQESEEGVPQLPPAGMQPDRVYNNNINSGIKINNYAIRVNSAQQVEEVNGSSGAITSIAVLGGGQIDSVARAKLVLAPKKGDGGAEPYIKNDAGGGIKVVGELSGEGSVYCSGDIMFQGRSQLSASPDRGVSLYAGGDIELRSIDAVADQDIDTSRMTAMNRDLASALSGYFDQELGELPYGAQPRIPSDETKQTLKDVVNMPYTDGNGQYWPTFKDYMSETYGIKGQDSRSLLLTMITKNSEQVTEVNLNTGHTGRSWMVRLDDVETISVGGSVSSGAITIQDMMFMGLIYTRGNFKAVPDGNSLSITGGLVARGTEGDINSGAIIVDQSGDVNFHYDPSYLKLLNAVSNSCRIKKLFWNVI